MEVVSWKGIDRLGQIVWRGQEKMEGWHLQVMLFVQYFETDVYQSTFELQ
jgi:hypothetical protein